jgi:hypothetical protein
MPSDLEFVLELRRTVSRYLSAVDGWESAFKRFSNRRGYQEGLSPELDKAQAAYRAARKELEAAVPRARRLGQKYGARDPWTGLLRVAMGQTTIGRNERAAIEACLDHLMAASKDDVDSEERPYESPEGISSRRLPPWLERVKNYFL